RIPFPAPPGRSTSKTGPGPRRPPDVAAQSTRRDAVPRPLHFHYQGAKAMQTPRFPPIGPLALALLLACAGASLPAMAGITCDLYDGDPGTEDNGGADTGTQDDRAVACGSGAVAGLVATAIGTNAQATGRGSVALGYQAHATGSATIALGIRANASGAWSFAAGEGASSSAWGAIALGVASNAGGQFSAATGVYSQAGGENSMALGGFLGTSAMNIDAARFTQAT